ncbi:MAG: thioredoxin domain-containing protein [Pseudomonadota bacterium]
MTAPRSMSAAGLVAASAALALTLAPTGPSAAQELENPKSDFVDNLPPQVWVSVVERTERGHRIGKPEADAQLIEFISYTCGHCADFAKQSDGTLDLRAIGPGYIAVEVRPVIRNYLDLVVTMLAQCGDPAGFKNRHRAFLYSQDVWLQKAINAPQSQQAIWARGGPEARSNAARALDLDDVLIQSGQTVPQVNACLADQAKAQEIIANDRADRTQFGITGTPTFALNGETLKGVHDWPALASTLQEAFRPEPQESVTGG